MRRLRRWTALALLQLCALLDRVPAYEQGRWYRCGGWGCRLRLSRPWACWNIEDAEER